jgi:threonine aldolase
MTGIPCANPPKFKAHRIDLRSDTVTLPTDEMRHAMANAEVGDDVYAEDPTINRLEARAAEIFGREAAIFVPSGSMGNQIAVKLHTRPGQEVICEQRAHVYNYEMGMMSLFSACSPRTIYSPEGYLTWDLIQPKISPPIYYYAPTSLIVLENTANMAGGVCIPPEVMDDVCDHAHEVGLKVHLDGARIFNASVALGRPVSELTRKFDSVMFCLSKGLGAPVGSLLVGSKEFITAARSVRKSLGGGMRQAGILAAAGLIALEKSPARLHEDHDNAKFLAQGLSRVPGVKIDLNTVQTNILVFDVSGTGITAQEFSKRLGERNVLAGAVNRELMRFVTHCDVNRADCEQALEAVEAICGARAHA